MFPGYPISHLVLKCGQTVAVNTAWKQNCHLKSQHSLLHFLKEGSTDTANLSRGNEGGYKSPGSEHGDPAEFSAEANNFKMS